MEPISVTIIITWLKGHLLPFLGKKAADKSFENFLSQLSEKNLSTAIQKSSERTAQIIGVPFNYQLNGLLKKESDLAVFIAVNYKKDRKAVVRRIKTGLVREGADPTTANIDGACEKFLITFDEELRIIEKIPYYQVAHTEEMNGKLDTLLDLVRKQTQPPPTLNIIVSEQVITSDAVIVTPPTGSEMQEGDRELENSKYKNEIQTAKTLIDNSQYELAREIYLKLLGDFETDPNPPATARFKVHTNLGVCERNLGNNSIASENFKIAFTINSKSIVALKNMAAACLLDNKPLDGLPYIDAALVIAPEDIESLNMKASLYVEAGMLDDAIKIYMKRDKKND